MEWVMGSAGLAAARRVMGPSDLCCWVLLGDAIVTA